MIQKSFLRNCPICQEVKGWRLHGQRFTLSEDHPLKEGYDVVACESCGFVFADTAVSQEDYDRYYASLSKYADAATSTGGGALSWDAARLKETAELLARFEPNRDAWILDMGCASGGMLKALQDLGYGRLAGIDPSPGCAQATRNLTGAETWTGTLFKCPGWKAWTV
ncbi:MAG: hypothetical protein HC904_03740 [Blastochloris sp.]|nr:hypothetical protein [Blastochloris sp.]